MSRARDLASYIATGVMPTQPAFLLQGKTGTAISLTSAYQVITNTHMDTTFDQASDVASGVFTAPFTGKYVFSAYCYHYSSTSGNSIHFSLLTSNNEYLVVGAARSGSTNGPGFLSVITDMDASDTAQIRGRNWDSSTGSVSISAGQLWFSGYLAV